MKFLPFFFFLFILSFQLNAQIQATKDLDQFGHFDNAVYPLLENQDVRGVEKDKWGRFWLATFDGLQLFDGEHTFKPLKELAQESILNIAKNEQGDKLIILSQKLLGILDLATLKYHILKYHSIKDYFWNYAIKKDIHGSFYTLLPDQTFLKISSQGRILKQLNLKQILSGNTAVAFTLDKDSVFFVERGFNPYIFSYNLQNSKGKRHLVKTSFQRWLRDIEYLGKNRFLIVDITHGFCEVSVKSKLKYPSNKTLDSLNKVNSFGAYGFQRWSDSSIFLIYQNGNIYQYSFRKNHTKAVKAIHIPDLLPHYYRPLLNNIDDRYGLTFNENGLYLINKFNYGISTALVRQTSKISTRNIIVDSSGTKYIGSYKGLFFSSDQNIWHKANDFIKVSGRKKRWTQSLPFSLYASHDYIYIGSEGYPFYRYDKKAQLYDTSFYRHPNYLNNNFLNVNVLCSIQNNMLLLGYSRGLALYDMKIQKLSIIPIPEWYRKENAVYCIKWIKNNQFLVGTKLGLFLLNMDDKSLKIYKETENVSVYDVIYLNAAKEIWVGTAEKGVDILEESGKLKKNIGTANGLPYPTIAGLTRGANGKIWILTSNGISAYKDQKLTNFFSMDGLADNGTNRFSYFNDQKGKISIGSINGISIIDETKLQQPTGDVIYTSQIKMWKARSNSYETISIGDIPKLQKIIIDANDKGLLISLGNSNLSNLGNADYEYRIKEISPAWQSIGKNGELRFDGLPYGLLHLEIRSVNRNNVRSKNTLRYTLLVREPFTRTPYFYIMLAVVVIVVLSFFMVQKAKNNRRLGMQRLEIARNLHDELGTLFTAIRYKLESLIKGEKIHSRELNKIYALTKEATNSIYENLWILDSKKDNLENLREKLLEISEDLLLNNNDSDKVLINIVVSDEKIHTMLKQQIYYIYKEAINNIAKHSFRANVYINITITGHNINMEFKNNNIKKGPSNSFHMGLANIQKRAKKINCRADFISANGWFVLTVKTHRMVP